MTKIEGALGPSRDCPPLIVNGVLPKPMPHPSLKRMDNGQLLEEFVKPDTSSERKTQLKTEIFRRMDAWKYREVPSAPPSRASRTG